MAKFNYQDFQQNDQGNFGQRPQVGFFGLKNNKDEAIVRFAFDSLDDLEFVTVHNVSVNGRYRKANCIRELNESVDKCPLCQAGVPLQQRVFVKLIQYDLDNRDASGKPAYSAKVWERSATFAKALQTFINEYGNLSEYVFKIVRNGNAGDMKTTYEILPCMPQVYNPELYVKDFSAFDGYTVVGTIVIDEDYNGLMQIQNGTWQPKTRQAEVSSETQQQINNWNPQTVAPPTVSVATTNTSQGVVPQEAVRPKRTYTY